jgi:uncharacterized protein (DUF362 family)
MAKSSFLQRIDRRTFLRIMSFTGAAGLIYPNRIISSLLPTTLSRIILVEDDSATSGYLINENTVQTMVNAGIKTLAQKDNLSDSWKTLLTGVDPTKKISIKVNCINSSMPTHPKVTYAVAESLKQLNFSGSFFPDNNIIIFDRTNWELQSCGYKLNTSGIGVRCFGTDSSGAGYSSQFFNVSGKNQKISKIVTEMADYLINIAVLKNHSMAGVTLCLKNHYGTCHNPGNLHSNDCDPYVPALNALDPILAKQQVNIIDALYGVKQGGPGGSPQFTPNQLLFSQDIVAADYWGRKTLQDNGCRTISDAHHVDTATTSYNLGTNNPAEMDVVKLTNPTTAANKREKTKPTDFVLEQNYPNPFNAQTQIRFYLPSVSETTLTIFNTTGNRIRRLLNNRLTKGWHQIIWDGLNDSGKPVASAVYLCRLKTGSFNKSIIMQMVK